MKICIYDNQIKYYKEYVVIVWHTLTTNCVKCFCMRKLQIIVSVLFPCFLSKKFKCAGSN